MRVREFIMRRAPPDPKEPLSAGGVPIKRGDGTRVLAGDLEVGKVYAVQEDGLLIETISRARRRAALSKMRGKF